VCAACPTPRLNQSYELRPPWEQRLRYVPHWVRNGYNSLYTKYTFTHVYVHSNTVRQHHYIEKQTQIYKKIRTSAELRVWKAFGSGQA